MLDQLAVGVEDRDATGRLESRNLTVLKLRDVRGDARQRGHVRGGVGALIRRRHDERRPVTGAHDLPGRVGADHRERP